MGEFNNGREIFDGRGKHKVTEYEGCPSDYNENLGDSHPHSHEGGAHGTHSHAGTRGTHNTRNAEVDPRAGGEVGGRRGLGNESVTEGNVTHKPSLKDKLNPFKDADGDGKKGLLD